MSLPTLTLLRALEWFKKSRLSSENLYHADLGSQNDGNSSRRELLWEMNNNNTSPDILCGVRWLFLVKANVSTSMKQQNYLVYCHLDQLSDEVAFSKCNCKPGQGGCWKHVTALLYCLLDYKNLEPKKSQMMCLALRFSSSGVFHPTVVRQKWSSLKNWLLRKLIMLETNKRKCPLVQWKWENYCSTPPYAKKVLDFYVFIGIAKGVLLYLYIAYFFMMVFHWFDWIIFLFFMFKLMK